MSNTKNEISTIFVDCFNTIIFRKVSTKDVFIEWAQRLSRIYSINWKTIYKTYKNINFKLCLKKIFTTFTLQEQFEVVLEKLFYSLSKKHNLGSLSNFIDCATKKYVQTELENFYINENMINYLKTEKDDGKKIYVVSDFYCKSNILTSWFTSLKINNIFEKIFSSSDFEKEKATTKIYKHLLNLLHLNPKNIIMYGDNVWSDVLMAKKCKLNAKRIKPKTILNTQRNNYEK